MELQKYIISEEYTVKDAMQAINENLSGMAFVCDGMKLLGAISDGNIRRYIINNGDVNDSIVNIYNKKPKALEINSNEDAIEFMRKSRISIIPIINKNKEILSLEFLNGKKVYRFNNLDIPVIIMAGGKGTRLAPYTSVLPKPLVPITDKTITELIMDKFEKFGCTKFDMIVNYKKNLIKAYFKELGKTTDVNFTDEIEFQGTGGGLKLVENKYNSTIFLTNCDILIDADYGDMINYHREQGNIATVVIAKQKIEIPYGNIITDDEGNIQKLQEKPSMEFNANTGLYILEHEFIKEIPENKFIHITDIITKCIEKGLKVGTYFVKQQAWQDMGQLSELELMKAKAESNK